MIVESAICNQIDNGLRELQLRDAAHDERAVSAYEYLSAREEQPATPQRPTGALGLFVFYCLPFQTIRAMTADAISLPASRSSSRVGPRPSQRASALVSRSRRSAGFCPSKPRHRRKKRDLVA